MNILALPQKLFIYFKQVKTELKKINWPTRKETIKFSLVVIGISAAVALFLGGWDFIFSQLFQKLISFFT